MSISLYLFSKKSPNKISIEKIITPLGFKPMEEPFDKLNLYYWFKEENYESLRGVHLDFSKAQPEDKELPKGTKTVFIATTYAGRSYEDINMQNNVIRSLRTVFRGSIYNDDEGKHAYISNDWPRLKPAEKRCGLIYSNFHNNINKAKLATSDLGEHYSARLKFDEGLASYDSGLIINNLVAVFLVSILENFLRDLFIAYVEMRPDLQDKIFEKTSKIDFQTLKALLEKEKSVVDVEADSYSFQNILSANRAYITYFQLNLVELWSKRKKMAGKFYKIRDVVQELINLRHKIVHNAYLKHNFNKVEVNRYVNAIEIAGKLLVNELEKSGFHIDLERHI